MKRKFKFFIGIDISKKTLDAAIISNNNPTPICYKFSNDPIGFNSFISWLLVQKISLNPKTLVVIEHTGFYQQKVIEFCHRYKLSLCAERANQIRWSLGMQRGKNDKIDSCRIALYGYKNRDTITCTNIPRPAIGKMQRLLGQRNRLINARKQLVSSLREMRGFIAEKEIKIQVRIQRPVIESLNKSIKRVEQVLISIIQKDELINNSYQLMISITGIGMITAASFIIYTNNFSRYKTGKKLACYCGVVPFERKSGTSVHGNGRISAMANKKLKMLLHMAAVTAIQHDEELKTYYYRKVGEGKAKMKVLNAVRNKLVLRISAVIKRGYVFSQNYQRKAA